MGGEGGDRRGRTCLALLTSTREMKEGIAFLHISNIPYKFQFEGMYGN